MVRRAARRFGWPPLLCGGILLVVMSGWGGLVWFRAWLRSEGFRRLVSEQVSARLGMQGEFLPFRWAGLAVHSDGYAGLGVPGRAVERLAADQVRAELALGAVLDRVWRVEHLEVERLYLVFRSVGERGASEASGTPSGSGSVVSVGGAAAGLPRRFELPEARIRSAEITWAGVTPGRVTGMRAELGARNGAWEIRGQAGRIALGVLPEMEIDAARLRWQAPCLHLLEVRLKEGTDGVVKVIGHLGPGSELDLRATLAGVQVARWLPGDWPLRVSGELEGESRVRRGVGGGELSYEGKLRVEGAQLGDWKVLDTIARYTRTDRFRNLVFQRISGNYTFEQGRLKVRAFEAESPGLIRIEGEFTVVAGEIDGAFQVGVTPASLRWLPGAEQRVFTVSRGGYLWAPMRLQGPLNAPSEDLSDRLAAAAPEAVLDGVRDAAGAAEGLLRRGADGLMDLLLPAAP